MTDTLKHGIYHRRGLTPAELADVRDLGRLCEEHDRIDLRLSWSAQEQGAPYPPSSFLSYRDGALAGFLSMYGLGDDAAEATGMVRPAIRRQGVFRALVDAAVDACRRQDTPSLILYVDSRSESAKAFTEAIGAERAFSEAMMRLLDAGHIREAAGALDVHAASDHEAAAIAQILGTDMDGDVAHLPLIIARNMRNPSYRYYIAALNGDPVGTLNIQTIDGDEYIYGFVVAPEYRGRGYGREILARVLHELAAERAQPVYLEVEPDNTPAVSLYRSLGFETLVTYDYYRLDASAKELI